MLNPYYDIPFNDTVGCKWITHKTLIAKDKIPARLRNRLLKKSQALEIILQNWARALAVISILIEYRCMPTSFCSLMFKEPIKPVIFDALFSLELIDFGFTFDEFYSSLKLDITFVKMHGNANKFKDTLRKYLTKIDEFNICQDKDIKLSSAHIRHDSISAYIAIKALELNSIGSVLGENSCKISEIVDDYHGATNAADCMLIRKDGLKIALEVTNKVNTDFHKKAEFWAKVLSNHRLHDSGLIVVFVDIAHKRWTHENTYKLLQNEITKQVKAHPGLQADKVADKMLLVRLEDWFAPNGATDKFNKLTCQNIYGSDVHLSNPNALSPKNPKLRVIFEKLYYALFTKVNVKFSRKVFHPLLKLYYEELGLNYNDYLNSSNLKIEGNLPPKLSDTRKVRRHETL